MPMLETIISTDLFLATFVIYYQKPKVDSNNMFREYIKKFRQLTLATCVHLKLLISIHYSLMYKIYISEQEAMFVNFVKKS